MAVALESTDAGDLAGSHIDPVRLSRQLARRGKTWKDLTQGPDGARLNSTTVTRVRHGKPVHPGTLQKLGRWLAATPVVPEIDAVLTAAPIEGAS